MTVHHRAPDCVAVPLSLASARRIVTPGLDPVLGWMGAEQARPAQSLIFPGELLEPSATANIAYACNLPAPPANMTEDGLPSAAGAVIADGSEAVFLAASLPGGQVPIISPEGAAVSLRFRWVCLTAHASIGAVWRCFIRTPNQPWTAVRHDYVFEAGKGALLNAPDALKLCAGASDQEITLGHPESMMTCFRCNSGRVKVTQLSADGWMRRTLSGLFLYPSRSIAARFSDGSETAFAVAAPGSVPPAVAA